MSSLQDLPLQLQVTIAGLVVAFSPQAMEDLRSLRVTCKQMHMACASPQVGRCLPPRQVLWRAFVGDDYAIHDFAAFCDALLDNLTSDVVGNPDACYLTGMHALRPSLHLLEHAAAAGHQLEVHMLGLCHYRPHGGASDNDKAFQLIRKVEGDEDEVAATGAFEHVRPRVWKNQECVRSRDTIWRDKCALLPALEPELVIWEGLDGYPAPLARPVLHGADDEDHCPDGYRGFVHRVDSDRWEYYREHWARVDAS